VFGVLAGLVQTERSQRTVMISVHVERLGELRVIECDASIVVADAALALSKSVISQADARVIVVDFSEIDAVEGDGVGILMALRQWTRNHNIGFKIFNPRSGVRARLEHIKAQIDIASLRECLDLLERAEPGFRRDRGVEDGQDTATAH